MRKIIFCISVVSLSTLSSCRNEFTEDETIETKINSSATPDKIVEANYEKQPVIIPPKK